jgi:hypothetical protein
MAIDDKKHAAGAGQGYSNGENAMDKAGKRG